MNIDKRNPIARRILTKGYGYVSVFEDTKHGETVPLIVVDENGSEVPNDYYDVEDISTLEPMEAE